MTNKHLKQSNVADRNILIQLSIILMLCTFTFGEDISCLTGDFIDVQDWALEDGSLSTFISTFFSLFSKKF